MSNKSEGKEGEGKDTWGEGKECEGKDAGFSPKREKFEVVDKVYEFCISSEFEGAFEDFSKEYSSVTSPISNLYFLYFLLFPPIL